jgi:uncharacterized protein YgiM (DUF1202 family)
MGGAYHVSLVMFHPEQLMTRMTLSLVIGLAMLAAASARAEDVWIKRQSDARADASAAADSVVVVQKGQKVHVLQRNGPWVQIDAGNGKTGWVAADSVSSREVKPDSNLMGHSSGAEMSSGAAIKGLQPIAGDYAQQRGLSKEGLDEMLAIRKSVTPQMLNDFVKDGNIQPGTPRKKPKESEK